MTSTDGSNRLQSRDNALSRRNFLGESLGKIRAIGAVALIGTLETQIGCNTSPSDHKLPAPDLIIGQRGLSEGRFQRPRALAINGQDELLVVDKTGRVQMFDESGKFIRGWRTPAIESGKPTGISVDTDGTIMVADTHYYRFLFYSNDGRLIEEKTIGGTNGKDPGQFAFVTDIVRAKDGNYYCGEYGEYDRIHKYSPDGHYIDRMGEHGTGDLQFSRPQSLCVDAEGLLWVADSCNHRIQVIDWREDKPRSVAILGGQGIELGQFQYPYGLTLTNDDGLVVSEYGNHRVQKLDRRGQPLSCWGAPGSIPGELNQPWASAIDSKQRVYVVDSGNNRVQRFRFS